MLKAIEKSVFKTLGLLPIKFKPLFRAIIYPLLSGAARLVGYLALCFIISKIAVKLLVNKIC